MDKKSIELELRNAIEKLNVVDAMVDRGDKELAYQAIKETRGVLVNLHINVRED